MLELVVTNFMSLDGVVQSVLSRDEDTDGGFSRGGWVSEHMDDEVAAFMRTVTTTATAMLLGRRTYEGFARVWASADPAEPAVAAMNGMPKYVVSTTLTRADWNNTHVLGLNLREQVLDLKSGRLDLAERSDGEVAIFGSASLARSLSSLGLIDRYQLLTFPLVIGSGKRMFEPGTTPTDLTLIDSRTTSSGVVISSYRPTPLH